MERGPVRVAVMADTHGVLRPEVEKIVETCDVIVHAGDFDTQMLYMKLSGKQPLYAVRGNNDRGWSGGLPGIKRFEIGGVKMVMAHQRTDIPVALGDAQVVIFGHSHMYQQQEIAGRLWLNPGSCGYKRNTLPLSMAVMTIEDCKYTVETIWLENGYGTPEAAIAQREKTKVSKIRKKDRNVISKSSLEMQMMQKKKNFCLPLQKSFVSRSPENPDCGSLKMWVMIRSLRQKSMISVIHCQIRMQEAYGRSWVICKIL